MSDRTNYTQGYSQPTLSSHASRTVNSDAAFLLPHIKPSDKILDIGCGPGTITVGFASYASEGSVLGIDLSEEVLTHARDHLNKFLQTVGDSTTGDVSFQKADLLAGLPFPDDTFDVVFSSQLFPHLPPPELPLRAVKEMRRVLKPGGVLACRDVAEIHWYPKSFGLETLWNGKMKAALSLPDFPGAGMSALVRDAGFSIDKIKIGGGTTVHSGLEGRRFVAEGLMGRLMPGDTFRDNWLKAGITEEEIKEIQATLKKWIVTDDAWYAALQCELLAWK